MAELSKTLKTVYTEVLSPVSETLSWSFYDDHGLFRLKQRNIYQWELRQSGSVVPQYKQSFAETPIPLIDGKFLTFKLNNINVVLSSIAYTIDSVVHNYPTTKINSWQMPSVGNVNLIEDEKYSLLIFNTANTPVTSLVVNYQTQKPQENMHTDVIPTGTITTPNTVFSLGNNNIDSSLMTIQKDGSLFSFIPVTTLANLKPGRVLINNNQPGVGATRIQFYKSDAPRTSVNFSYVHHNIVSNQIPTGIINGINTDFVIPSNTIQQDAFQIVKDGVAYSYTIVSGIPGVGEINLVVGGSETTLTFSAAETPLNSLTVNYVHDGISVNNEIPTGTITTPNAVFTVNFANLTNGFAFIEKDGKQFVHTIINSGSPTVGQLLLENPTTTTTRLTFNLLDAPFENLIVNGISYDIVTNSYTHNPNPIIDGYGCTFSLSNDNLESSSLMLYRDGSPFAFTIVSSAPGVNQISVENNLPTAGKTRITFHSTNAPVKTLNADYIYDRMYIIDRNDGVIYNVGLTHGSSLSITYHYMITCDKMLWCNKTRRFLTYDNTSGKLSNWRDADYNIVLSQDFDIKDFRDYFITDSTQNIHIIHAENYSKLFIVAKNGAICQLSWDQQVYPQVGPEIYPEPDPWVQGFWNIEKYPVLRNYLVESVCLSGQGKSLRFIVSNTSKRLGQGTNLSVIEYDFVANEWNTINITSFPNAFKDFYFENERFAIIDEKGFTIPLSNEVYSNITQITTEIVSDNYLTFGRYCIFSKNGVGLVAYNTETPDTLILLSNSFQTNHLEFVIDPLRNYYFIASGNAFIEVFDSNWNKIAQIILDNFAKILDITKQCVLGLSYDSYYKNLMVTVRSTYEKTTILNLSVENINSIYAKETIITSTVTNAQSDYMESRVVLAQNLPTGFFENIPQNRQIIPPKFGTNYLDWGTDLLAVEKNNFLFKVDDNGQKKIFRVSDEGILINPEFQTYEYDNVKITYDGYKVQWNTDTVLLQNNFENSEAYEDDKQISNQKNMYFVQNGMVSINNSEMNYPGLSKFSIIGNKYVHNGFEYNDTLYVFDKIGNIYKSYYDDLTITRYTNTTDYFTKIKESSDFIIGFNSGDSKFYFFNKGFENFRAESFHMMSMYGVSLADVLAVTSNLVFVDPNRKKIHRYASSEIKSIDSDSKLVQLLDCDDTYFYAYDFYNRALIKYNVDNFTIDSYYVLKYSANRIVQNGSNFYGIDDTNKTIFEINQNSYSYGDYLLAQQPIVNNSGYYIWNITTGPTQTKGQYRVYNEIGESLIEVYDHSNGLFVKNFFCEFIPEGYIACKNNPANSEDNGVYDMLLFAISYTLNKIQAFRIDIIGAIGDTFTLETIPLYWQHMKPYFINNAVYSASDTDYVDNLSYFNSIDSLYDNKNIITLQNSSNLFTVKSTEASVLVSCLDKSLSHIWTRDLKTYPYIPTGGTFVNITLDEDYLYVVYSNTIKQIDFTTLAVTTHSFTGIVSGAYYYRTNELIMTRNGRIYLYNISTKVSTDWSTKTKQYSALTVSGSSLTTWGIKQNKFVADGDDFYFINGEFIVAYNNLTNVFICTRFGTTELKDLLYNSLNLTLEIIYGNTYYKLSPDMSSVISYRSTMISNPLVSGTNSNISLNHLIDSTKSFSNYSNKYVSVEFKNNKFQEVIVSNTSTDITLGTSSATWTLNATYNIVRDYGLLSETIIQSGNCVVTADALTDTTKAWVVNAHAGLYVKINFGYGSTVDIVISSNTNRVLTLQQQPVTQLHPSYYIVDNFDMSSDLIGLTQIGVDTFLHNKNYSKKISDFTNYRSLGCIKQAIVDSNNNDIMYYVDHYSEKLMKVRISDIPEITSTKSYAINNSYTGNTQICFDGIDLIHRTSNNTIRVLNWNTLTESYVKQFNVFSTVNIRERVNGYGTIFTTEDLKNLYLFDETNPLYLKGFKFASNYSYCKKTINNTLYNFEYGILHELDLSKLGTCQIWFLNDYLSVGENINLSYNLYNVSNGVAQVLSDVSGTLKLIEFDAVNNVFTRTDLTNNLPDNIRDTYQINGVRLIRTYGGGLYRINGDSFLSYDSELANVICITNYPDTSEYVILYTDASNVLKYRLGNATTYSTKTLDGYWPISNARMIAVDENYITITNNSGSLFIGDKAGNLLKVVNLTSAVDFDYAYLFNNKLYYIDIASSFVHYRSISISSIMEVENELFGIPITLSHNIRDVEYFQGNLVVLHDDSYLTFIDYQSTMTVFNLGMDYQKIFKYRNNLYITAANRFSRVDVAAKNLSHSITSVFDHYQFCEDTIWVLIGNTITVYNPNNLATIDSFNVGTSTQFVRAKNLLFVKDGDNIRIYKWNNVSGNYTVTLVSTNVFPCSNIYDHNGKESILVQTSDNKMWKYGYSCDRPYLSFADFAEPGYIEVYAGDNGQAPEDEWHFKWDFMDIKKRVYHEAPYYDENRSFRVQVLDKYGEPVRRARVEWYIGNGYYAETLDDNNAQSSPGKYRTWQSNWAGNMKGWQYNPTTYYPDGNVRSWGFWYESSENSNSKNLQLDRWPDHQMDMIFIAYRSRKVL